MEPHYKDPKYTKGQVRFHINSTYINHSDVLTVEVYIAEVLGNTDQT